MHTNETGIIEKIEKLELPCVQRLMTFGLVEGTPIKYIGTALGGDPIEVEIYGSILTLRKECASHFMII